MKHDWSHLDEHAYDALQETYEIDGDTLSNKRECVVAVRNAVLDHLTPSDLAALVAEKCPGWVAVPKELNKEMQRSLWMNGVEECEYDVTRQRIYDELISAAPKLGEDN